jgi:hypothetical protein
MVDHNATTIAAHWAGTCRTAGCMAAWRKEVTMTTMGQSSVPDLSDGPARHRRKRAPCDADFDRAASDPSAPMAVWE